MSAAIEIRDRVRAAVAYATVASLYDDNLDDRFDQIEQARLALARAAEHLKRRSVLLCDQCMAEAAGYLL